jgi:hypothetical protein
MALGLPAKIPPPSRCGRAGLSWLAPGWPHLACSPPRPSGVVAAVGLARKRFGEVLRFFLTASLQQTFLHNLPNE